MDRRLNRLIVAAIAVALVFVFFPRRARAEGALYIAHDPDKTFPLTRTEVKTDVAGEIVSTTVTQRFQNTFKERIEVVYVFPLPHRAAVDDMEMHVGARVIRADIRKRAEAQAAYDAAARRGQRAALLEEERPNIFTFSVANVDPGAEIEVRLHYFELAKYDKGTYEIVFPMVVGPRYVPGRALAGAQSGTGTRADSNRVPDASRITPAYVPPHSRSGHTIGLSVRVEAGAPIESIESPAHDVQISRVSATTADLSLRDKAEIPNRDFVLRWRLVASELKAALFAHRPEANGDGYLAILLEPKHDPGPHDIAPRELFFLLDTSGSMRGTPLQTAVLAVGRAIDAMQPWDTFQIIDFADSASTFASRPLANTKENVRHAREYLSHLQGRGGTNQLAGIHAALSAPGDDRRVRFVVFMTDGYIGNEQEVISLTKREIGGARIYGFGVGSSVNRHLLDEVSHVGRGTAEYLLPREEGKELVDRFYERIGKPFVTDLQIDWATLPVVDMVPARPLDLSAFQPAVILARYKAGAKGTMILRGKIGGRPFEQKVDVNLPDKELRHTAISRVWAREKIGELSRGATAGENEQEITRIALSHHLVTKYTSLVAIDDAPGERSGFPMLVSQPSEAPEEVDLRSAGARYATVAPDVHHEPLSTANSPAPEARAPRGCGGCVVGQKSADRDVWLGLGLFTMIAALRLRKRTRRTES